MRRSSSNWTGPTSWLMGVLCCYSIHTANRPFKKQSISSECPQAQKSWHDCQGWSLSPVESAKQPALIYRDILHQIWTWMKDNRTETWPKRSGHRIWRAWSNSGAPLLEAWGSSMRSLVLRHRWEITCAVAHAKAPKHSNNWTNHDNDRWPNPVYRQENQTRFKKVHLQTK